MTSKLRLLLLISAAALLFASCEVEFSPNAEWKEVPVVYCVLDQDDSISYVRVERCYLAEGDIYAPGRVSDSINYPEGALRVTLYQQDGSGALVDSIDFGYDTLDHAEGSFAAAGQPIYSAVTHHRLRNDASFTYILKVRHAADGKVIASSSTKPIVKTNSVLISDPNNNHKFGFRPGSSCDIKWYTLTNGRLYQPRVRFYYKEGPDTMFVDITCPQVLNSRNSTDMHLQYGQSEFLTALKAALQDDPNPKTYLKTVDIYLLVCNEDLNAYMSTVSSTYADAVWSNIEGGLGVFAARRTHLFKNVPADESDTPGSGLYALLRDLGVGID